MIWDLLQILFISLIIDTSCSGFQQSIITLMMVKLFIKGMVFQKTNMYLNLIKTYLENNKFKI